MMNCRCALEGACLVSLVCVLLCGCDVSRPAAPQASITFEVTVPADTPVGTVVRVVGSERALGSNTAPGFMLRRQAEGRYTGTALMPLAADVSFELWQDEVWRPEAAEDGSPVPRRTLRVEGDMTVSVSVARWGAPAKGPPRPQGLAGIIRYHRQVASAHVAARDIIVYLPPDYFDAPERRYPVLYLHDGQNLMDAATSYAGAWGVDEAAEQLILAGRVEPLILIDRYRARIPVPPTVKGVEYAPGKVSGADINA